VCEPFSSTYIIPSENSHNLVNKSYNVRQLMMNRRKSLQPQSIGPTGAASQQYLYRHILLPSMLAMHVAKSKRRPIVHFQCTRMKLMNIVMKIYDKNSVLYFLDHPLSLIKSIGVVCRAALQTTSNRLDQT